jgi:hypothetical protein
MTLRFVIFSFVLLLFSCSKEENTDPDPLTVSAIRVVIESQSINLTSNSDATNILLNTPIDIDFSKAVEEDWLTNPSLPRVTQLEDGNAVAGVQFDMSFPENNSIMLTLKETLLPQTNYRVTVNPGYEAEVGGKLEDPGISVQFTTCT